MCLCHCMFSFIFMPWIAFMYSISQLATLCFSSRSSSTSTTHDTFCIVLVICQASNNIHHVQDRHAGCGQEDIDQGQEAQMGQERVSCSGIITVGLNSPLSRTISPINSCPLFIVVHVVAGPHHPPRLHLKMWILS